MNKGFTLIELLGVIALLAIIATIAFPSIQKSINSSREKTLEQQKLAIISASKRWVADNNSSLEKVNGKVCYLSISKLQSDGYLVSNKEIKDPTNDNKKMNGCVKVSWDGTYNQFLYEYGDTCSNSC